MGRWVIPAIIVRLGLELGSFPLTLALSLGEREQLSASSENSNDSSFISAEANGSPSPRGRGRGEGKGNTRTTHRARIDLGVLLSSEKTKSFESFIISSLQLYQKSLMDHLPITVESRRDG